MKKIIISVLSVSLVLCLSACTSRAEEEWHNSEEYKELMEDMEDMQEIIDRSEENMEHLDELWDDYEERFGDID